VPSQGYPALSFSLFVFILTSQLSARVWIPVVYDGLSPILDIPTLSIMCGLERDTPIPGAHTTVWPTGRDGRKERENKELLLLALRETSTYL
jgi:hypothetical protein